ncbi:MAG: hypothetical protein GSR87_04475 [Desulfurococcales archaeon]|nr:hypothetical protein [Desulfurococcales archaeon]
MDRNTLMLASQNTTIYNVTEPGKEVLPPSLTLAGALIQWTMVGIFLLGPAPFFVYIAKTSWADAIKAALYAGILSFLVLVFLRPLGPLAVLVAFPIYMWALKIRFGNDWREAFRISLVVWGVLLLPLLLAGSEVLKHFEATG